MSDTQHPQMIINQWHHLLDAIEAPSHHVNNLSALISKTLPSFSRASIEFTVQTCVDCEVDIPGVDLSQLTDSVRQVMDQVSTDELPATSSKYRTSHPLAASIELIAKQAIHSNLLSEYLECLLTLTDVKTDSDAMFDSCIYYNHVLAVRTTLLSIDKNLSVLDPTFTQTIQQRIEHLIQLVDQHDFDTLSQMGFTLKCTDNERYQLLTTQDLLTHELRIGQRLKNRLVSPDHEKGQPQNADDSEKINAPPTHIEPIFTESEQQVFRSTYRAQRQKNTVHRAPQENRLSRYIGLAPAWKTLNQGSQNNDADGESDDPDMLQITFPDVLQTEEEKTNFDRRLKHFFAGQNVVSQSDMNRLSSQQVIEDIVMMAFNDYEGPAVLCLLLYSTGISAKRMTKLRISKQPPVGDELYLHPITGILSYRVLNSSASGEPGSKSREDDPSLIPENQLMQLAIPECLVSFILSLGGEQPFNTMEFSFKGMKHTLKNKMGYRVHSLVKYQSTCDAFDKEEFNRLESRYKRGDIGFENSAASAYREIKLENLHEKQSSCWSRVRKELRVEWGLRAADQAQKKPFPEYLRIKPAPVTFTQTIGSRRYHPPKALGPLFKAIEQKVKQLNMQLKSKSKVKTLSQLITFMNVQQLNYWFLLHVHSLGRPCGHITQLGVHHGYLWCSDKANATYRERKLIAIASEDDLKASPLLRQQTYIMKTLSALTAFSHKHKITVEGLDLSGHQSFLLPQYISYSSFPSRQLKRRPASTSTNAMNIQFSVMSPTLLHECLNELGLKALFPCQPNLFRHIASTELSTSHSDALVDEALGHKHPGRDMWGLESSANPKDMGFLIEAIARWVSDMGVKPIQINPSVFGGVYDIR